MEIYVFKLNCFWKLSFKNDNFLMVVIEEGWNLTCFSMVVHCITVVELGIDKCKSNIWIVDCGCSVYMHGTLDIIVSVFRKQCIDSKQLA